VWEFLDEVKNAEDFIDFELEMDDACTVTTDRLAAYLETIEEQPGSMVYTIYMASDLICDYLGTAGQDLKFEKSNTIDTDIHQGLVVTSATIKLLGKVNAGYPGVVYPDPEDVYVPSWIADKYPDAFVLEVHGESMNKVFRNGALVVINPKKEIPNGHIGVFEIDGEYTLKRITKSPTRVLLDPDSYDDEFQEPIIYKANQIDHIRCIGEVVYDFAAPNTKY